VYDKGFFKGLSYLKRFYISTGIKAFIEHFRDSDERFIRYFRIRSKDKDKESAIEIGIDWLHDGMGYLGKDEIGLIREEHKPMWNLIREYIHSSEVQDVKFNLDYLTWDLYDIGIEYFLKYQNDTDDEFVKYMTEGLDKIDTDKPMVIVKTREICHPSTISS